MRRRLSSAARAALYASECEQAKAAGRGDYPICRLCPHPILPGQTWDQSHEQHKPRWLGGAIDGIAHSRCNRIWNNIHDTPKFAKSQRVRKRHLDLTRSLRPCRVVVTIRASGRCGARWSIGGPANGGGEHGQPQ